MSSDFAIKVENLSKCYHIYEQPRDRLLQMLNGRRKKYYREFWALNDVSFEVKKGETVGIIGRNGSGKSTLLQMICGTLNPTSGTIQTNGRIAALLELGSGFNPEFTGRENVYLNASVLGLTNEEIHERFDKIAEFADIGDFIEQPIKTYSSGMVVRLAFAVIAHVDADILVIDEALSVGDAFFTQKCMRFLRTFMNYGTVMFVSHDTGAVINLCDTAVLLSKGSLIEIGSPKDICEYYLEELSSVQNGKRPEKIESIKKHAGTKESKPNGIRTDPTPKLSTDIPKLIFDPEASSFGLGGAEIRNVLLLDETQCSLPYIAGGETVILRIVAELFQEFESPIVGFYVKDRLGQALFGDNTFLSYQDKPINVRNGEVIQADFKFTIPLLPPGDYSITVAIANGTQEIHEQHHWIHDAVVFRCESNSIVSGLVGIPMQDIRLNIV